MAALQPACRVVACRVQIRSTLSLNATMASILVPEHYYEGRDVPETGAYITGRRDGTLPDDGLHRREPEDLVLTAAPFQTPISSELLLPDSNILSYRPRSVLVNPSNHQYNLGMINHTSLQVYYQQRHQGSIVAIQTNPFSFLASHTHFLPRIDSIPAELFSGQRSSYNHNPIDLLENFRQKTISAYGGDVQQVPSMFSYARVANQPFKIPIQFGVSAPRGQSLENSAVARMVRDYRVRQCWGEQKPPTKEEAWRHGHCAESQSLPSVVALCERLDLKDVVVHTLAVDKSGKFVGMCKNCRLYVYLRILRDHPTWRVFDVCARKTFRNLRL